MRARGPLVSGLWLVLLTTSACGGGIGTYVEDDPPVIVATTTIVGDLTALVAGQEATVEVLMPIGADPADYEPTPEQKRRLLEADLIVASGLGLEAGLAWALSDAERRGVPILRLGENLCPLDASDGTTEACDPYWWMDPLRAAGAVSLIADRLLSVHDGHWVMRAMEADRSLGDLDSVIRGRLSRCETWPREIVTSEPGLGYFAERYDCLITLPDAAPADTPGPSSSGRDPARVALFIDSLGGPGSAAETYADMMLTNADRLAHAGPVAFVERTPTRP
jgi:zinc/manganese transport system substrate-binding protein